MGQFTSRQLEQARVEQLTDMAPARDVRPNQQFARHRRKSAGLLFLMKPMTEPAIRHSGNANGAPMRIIARAISEMINARAHRWAAAVGTNALDTLLLQVILSANIAHGRLGHATPDHDRRPLSIMAIAESMGLAYTTVRRRTNAMRRTGLIATCGGGELLLPHDAFAAILGEKVMAGDARDARAYIALVAAAGYGPAIVGDRWSADAGDAFLSHLMLELVVRVMQGFVDLYGGHLSGLICANIVRINVRHLVDNPELGRRYATSDQVPGDDERRPITLRALAREMRLPFETVRRQVQLMKKRGVVEEVAGGLIVPTRVIMGDAHHRYNLFIVVQSDRMLAALPMATSAMQSGRSLSPASSETAAEAVFGAATPR